MEDPRYFPLFFDIRDVPVLVVGAGPVATRRIRTLLPFRPAITVVAPEATDEVREMEKLGRIRRVRRVFEPEDLQGAAFVLTATGNSETDGTIQLLCRELHIPVNVASDRNKCDFFFPGIAMRDNLVVGITASGLDHREARRLTEDIRKLLSERDG